MGSSSCRRARTRIRRDTLPGSLPGDAMSRDATVIPLTAGRAPVDALRRPIHDLRISVMDRCNFRCPYCMPRETFHDAYRFLKSNERLDFAELLRLARVFVRAGVKKMRI